MATSKRAPSRKPRKKGKSGKKGGARGRRTGQGSCSGCGIASRKSPGREVVGGVLLVAGLFFSAAFLSGRGLF